MSADPIILTRGPSVYDPCDDAPIRLLTKRFVAFSFKGWKPQQLLTRFSVWWIRRVVRESEGNS